MINYTAGSFVFYCSFLFRLSMFMLHSLGLCFCCYYYYYYYYCYFFGLRPQSCSHWALKLFFLVLLLLTVIISMELD